MSPLRLIAYGMPAVPLAIIGIPLFIYLPTYYSRDLGLDLTAVGGVLLLARLWDVITDPAVGVLSDRTRGRFGRRKPWMLLGTPPLLISIWALFLPAPGIGAGYLLAWSLVLYLAWTMLTLPYQSWGAELSDRYHERTRIAAAREGGVVLGTALATGLPLLFGGGEDAAGPTIRSLAWIAIIGLPVALFVCFRATPDPPPARLTQALEWRAGLAAITGNRPFRRLLIAYLINGVANGLPATLFLLFVAEVVQTPERFGLLLFLYFVAGLAAVPLWTRLSFRFGKHRTWSLSMLWVSAVFCFVPFLGPGDFVPYLLICLFSGIGLGADLVLPTAMQADVVDVDAAETGNRRTGVYFALWGMATKLALALAVGIAFPLLDLVGFKAGGGNEPDAILALALLYGGFPVVFKLVATALVWRFPLDEAAQAKLKSRTMRNGAAPAAKGEP